MCADHDPELWFGPHVCTTECDGQRGCYIAKAETGRYRRIETAKALCRSCPAVAACLEWALESKIPYGVWGKSTERDRRVMLRRAKDEFGGDIKALMAAMRNEE